jgi:hypothetical protein
MPNVAESPPVQRPEVPHTTALGRVQALYELGEVGLAFEMDIPEPSAHEGEVST